MKVFIMTDCEGVAGVINWPDYAQPGARCYEKTLELTTLETNAAIEGAIEAGATEILVADGHGHGAIEPSLLHPAARLMTGRPQTYPFGCDESYEVAFIIGQHAKSNADGGHLAHSGSFAVDDMVLNGRSVGEIALIMLSCEKIGVPVVFLAGDEAACLEAQDLVPEIETAPVKWGVKRGSAAGLDARSVIGFNGAAIHLAPQKSREVIKAAARRAIERRHEISCLRVEPPYELEMIMREMVDQPRRRALIKSDTIGGLFDQPHHFEPITDETKSEGAAHA